ncbi:alpha/beta fold hydrolase [Elizabethkingia argentiflava]|uniref:Alpha/beta fold hydrolase n=1 Tax=Elizabethkingia argenteiflava TaxID=2681556 RepID=A0A845PXC8_9FLAO|nr:alpha/beta fold hydrolase [Elizabethkingia argenteiflava]NAW51127.1 alpha/beta fold hydrolase [Elizabethkingia argenteiflava]
MQISKYFPENAIDAENNIGLFYTLFTPQHSEVVATLLILHGMQEHSGRYTEFAKYMVDEGLAVITYDHRGHGRTAKKQSDLGFFKKTKAEQKLIDDAEAMGGELERLYPNVPHFVLGHSMGSFIMRCLLQQASHRFKGGIMVGTGRRVKGAKVGLFLFSLLNRILPRYRSRCINKFFSWQNNKYFKHEPNERGTNWLSVDRSNRQAFLQDRLCGIDFTHNAFYTLIALHIRATKIDWAQKIPKAFSLFFVSGEQDPIGHFGSGIRESLSDLKQEGFQDVQMKLYSGMRHEILNESIKEEVYHEIRNWVFQYI